jgi:hypothetical protein
VEAYALGSMDVNDEVCVPLAHSQDRIQGDLGELRKTQAERHFKIWRKH